ncbi:MAG: LCP family protein [Clostridiales bacterium]|nr:LCP family protein [Clostridiales bacterium]
MRTDRRGLFCRKIMFPVLAGAVSLTALTSGCGKNDNTEEISSAETETQSQVIDNTIEWKGKTYTYNRNLTNILFIGVDTTDPIGETYSPGDAGQADCIILLSLDEETEQGTIIQINRNTITTLDVYDDTGSRAGSVEGQLCLQYAYSIGGESSSWAVKKTVGSILYGVTIDGYFTMQMDVIGDLNDAMGGVDIFMTEDYTYIDSSFIEGTTVHLEGDQAERYVRYRDTSVFNSVEDRMKRQVEYITSMISTMRAQGGTKLYDIISPYLGTEVVTDMSAEELNALSSYEYLTDEVQYLPGEEVMGEVYEEYHLDEDALQDLLISIFYTEVE